MSFMVKFCIVNQKGHIRDVILHFTTKFFFFGTKFAAIPLPVFN